MSNESKVKGYKAVGSFTVLTDKGVACTFVKGVLITNSKGVIEFLDSKIGSGGIDYIEHLDDVQLESISDAEKAAAPKPSTAVTGITGTDKLKVIPGK